ncbi:hypothetical protein WA538_000343, partial [Blastocystis sp. DL]
MDLQITSTLNLLSQSVHDKGVQTHGMRYLIDCCSEDLSDDVVSKCPVIPTLSTSIRENFTVKAVVSLGCHCLIAYARFPSCQKAFFETELDQYLCSQISRLASESVIALELAVLSTYASCGYPLVESQWNRILQTLLKVEKRWTAALPVVQQLVSNYSILAEQESLHASLLTSCVLADTASLMRSHPDDESLQLALLMTCEGLAKSAAGRQFLCQQHICSSSLAAVARFPANRGICACCIHIVFALNRDASSRGELSSDGGIALLTRVLNATQRDETLAAEALQAFRSVCSASETVSQVVAGEVVGSLLMALLSHPLAVAVQQHGLRALEWVAASGPAAARALVDEGVFEVAAEVLRRHDDTEVLRYLCATLAKVVRFDPNDACLAALRRSGCLPAFRSLLQTQQKNEAVVAAGSVFLATLASQKAFCADLVALDFPELALALLNGVSQAETVALLTGTLWKMALLPEARPRLAEGLDALLHSLQTFPLHAGIQRNALGALFNVSLSDGSLPQRLLSRLALPVILDSLDALRSDGAVALQGVSLLQSLMKNAGCRAYLLGHGSLETVIAVMQCHERETPVLVTSLLFLDTATMTQSGRTQLAQSPEMVAYLEHLLTQYDPAATDTGSIAKGILRKVSIGTLSGS